MKVLGTNFSPWSGCYFFAKHTALRRTSKDWLARNQDNMSEWGDTCLSTTVVSLRYKNPTKRVDLVQSGPNHHFIEN